MTELGAARLARLDQVLTALGRRGVDAVPLPSDSNDVWRVGDAVLQICYRGDRARIARAALVSAALPAAVKAPKLLDYGGVGDMTWQLSALVDGVPLGVAWPTLALPDRRRAIQQVGESLAELNGHTFPAAVRSALSASRPVGDMTATAVIGADLNPLPVSRARLLLEPAARLTGVDRSVIEAVSKRFDALQTTDPLNDHALFHHGGGVVVHGDAHPMNVLWNDGVVALLDWEWVRLGAPELEIEPFLGRGFEDHPSLTVDSSQIAGWLAEGHPDAFAAPDLVRRVWLIELAHTLRHLLLWPPDRPEHLLPVRHPMRTLRRIATAPSHLCGRCPRPPPTEEAGKHLPTEPPTTTGRPGTVPDNAGWANARTTGYRTSPPGKDRTPAVWPCPRATRDRSGVFPNRLELPIRQSPSQSGPLGW